MVINQDPSTIASSSASFSLAPVLFNSLFNSAFGGEHSSIDDENRCFHPNKWAPLQAQQSIIHPYPMERYLDATWMIWIGRSSSQFKLPTQESHKTNGERSTEQPKGSRNRSRLGGGSDGVTVVGNLLSLLNFSLPQNNGRYAAPRRSPAPCSIDVCASAHSNSLCLGRIRC